MGGAGIKRGCELRGVTVVDGGRGLSIGGTGGGGECRRGSEIGGSVGSGNGVSGASNSTGAGGTIGAWDGASVAIGIA